MNDKNSTDELEVSDDVEMDEELVDKVTGKKLTFTLPAASGSKGAGRSSGPKNKKFSSSGGRTGGH